MQETIEDLQSRLAFQEDAIDQLNKTVVEQHNEIQLLQKQLKYLNDQMEQMAEQQQQQGAVGHERPPHY